MDLKLLYFNKLAFLLSSFLPQANPEVFFWVLVQRESGKNFEQIKNELINIGWSNEITDQIILYAREDSQVSYNPQSQNTPKESQESIHRTDTCNINQLKTLDNKEALPGILFDNSPNRLFVGDKHIDLVFSMEHPRIVLFDNFLDDKECLKLIRISQSRLEKSKTMGSENYDTPEANDARTSSGAFFNPQADNIFKIIDKRISKMLKWDETLGEALHILQYKPGQQYKPHYDYFSTDYIESQRKNTDWGQRVGTVLLYLNEVESGGCTIFPDTGISVHPKKGSALFFAYNDNPTSLSLHGGAPVISGIKYVATKWLRTK